MPKKFAETFAELNAMLAQRQRQSNRPKPFSLRNESITKVIWHCGNEDNYMELLAHQNGSMTYAIKRLWKPRCQNKNCNEVNYVGRLWTVPFVKGQDPLQSLAEKQPKLSYRCERCRTGYVFQPDFGESEWTDFNNNSNNII